MDLSAGKGTAGVAPGLRVDLDGDVVVLSLTGEHDISGRAELERTIGRALQSEFAVVVDLREATFVDSVVAAVLLEARKVAKHGNLGFGIVLSPDPENAVRRMFELSTLTTVFAVFATREAAVAAVRDGFVEPSRA